MGAPVLDAAVAALDRGEVVLVPTDTVYGLAARPEATARVSELKQRPPERNLPFVIGAVAQLADLGVEVNTAAAKLIEAFWPGGLTIVFGFTAEPPLMLAGRDEVAVRFPDDAVVPELARRVGPLVLTSANLSDEPTPTTFAAAFRLFGESVGAAIDGGELGGLASTIVNIRVDPPVVERPGAIDEHAIRQALH